MTAQTWLAILGIGVPATVALIVGLRQTKSSDKTGMAAQFAEISERLSNTETRGDALTTQIDDLRTRLGAAETREENERREAEKWRQVSVALWGVIVRNGHLEVPPWVEDQLRGAGMIP